ncbi:MAG: glycosyltransferase family 2 protein [Anaerolineales bacterium]|nr:glycosyltransferase family 2 protein [Anaerolineales bacterium]
MSAHQTTVDLVIPIFNEAGVVERAHQKICNALDALPYQLRFIYVDDGSNDGTAETLSALAHKDPRVTLLQLSRNFGHQAALSAGLDYSSADVVISLDGDGQHPPELIPQMIDLVTQGFDIVQGQRAEASAPSFFKNLTSQIFYRLLNLVSGMTVLPGAADFRAMSRQAVEGLKSMPEYHRFLRGMVSWMGYKTVILPYQETKRIAGRSKYSLGKMFRLASDAIFSFSLTPLYIGLSAGLLFFILACVQVIYVSNLWLTGQFDRIVPGWSSLMAIILIASGTIMILLGFIGVYIGYIFQEVKRRPVYLIRQERADE